MIIVSWIIFSFVAAYVGKGRKIGGGWAFFWSLLLSPLIGLIIAFSSDKIADSDMKSKMLDIQQKQVEELQSMKSAQKTASSKTITEQLKEAKELLNDNAITLEEFEDLKKKILNN